jgi:hypothetical protein
MIMEMMANSEEGMVAGVALGIAVFIALSAGIYFGWTLGLNRPLPDFGQGQRIVKLMEDVRE